MSTFPPYVDIPGRSDASVIPPGVFSGARAWAFGAYGDRTLMQNLADSLITKPSGGEWKATVPTSLCLFIFFNEDRLDSPSQPIGWTPNNEFSLAMPVIVRHAVNPLSFHFGLLPAWVYIDNYRGLVTGRESWGWFKNLGTITAPKTWSPQFQCTLDTLIFQPAAASTEGQVSTLVQVTSDPASVVEPDPITGDEQAHHQTFLSLIKHHIEDDALDLFLQAAAKLHTLQAPAFNLKQIRDVADGTKACHQSITTSPLQVQSISNAQLLHGSYSIRISPAGNADICSVLGLSPTTPVQFGIGADVVYSAVAGQTLWSYSG